MPYEFYKILHMLSLAGILLPIGAIIQHSLSGGSKETLNNRKFLLIIHGVSMFLMFVAGFGLIAKLGTGFPGWIWAKLVIWLIFGGVVTLAMKNEKIAMKLLFLLPILVGIATYLVRYRPF